jgi:hypothetical protein
VAAFFHVQFQLKGKLSYVDWGGESGAFDEHFLSDDKELRGWASSFPPGVKAAFDSLRGYPFEFFRNALVGDYVGHPDARRDGVDYSLSVVQGFERLTWELIAYEETFEFGGLR